LSHFLDLIMSLTSQSKKAAEGIMSLLSRFILNGEIYFLGTDLDYNKSKMRPYLHHLRSNTTHCTGKMNLEKFFSLNVDKSSEEKKNQLKQDLIRTLKKDDEDYVYELVISQNNLCQVLAISKKCDIGNLQIAKIRFRIPKTDKDRAKYTDSFWKKMADAITRLTRENGVLRQENTELADEIAQLQKSLDKKVNEKLWIEHRMLEAFVPILKTKKRRLSELEGELGEKQTTRRLSSTAVGENIDEKMVEGESIPIASLNLIPRSSLSNAFVPSSRIKHSSVIEERASNLVHSSPLEKPSPRKFKIRKRARPS